MSTLKSGIFHLTSVNNTADADICHRHIDHICHRHIDHICHSHIDHNCKRYIQIEDKPERTEYVD